MDQQGEAKSPPRGLGVQLDAVHFSYPSARGPSLGPVDLTLEPSEVVALVGPSGCGKSTLLRVASGLLTPTSGAVARSKSAPSIGLAPQEPTLLPWLSIAENVALPAQLGTSPAEAGGEIDALLARMRLSAWRDAAPSALSGGMQSRAALARALLGAPDLLLLDEPFGSLDEVTAEAVMLDLSELLAEKRPTTIFVSHSLSQAAFLSDRVAVLSPTPARVAGLIEVNLPRPRTRDMLASATLDEAVARIRAVLRDMTT